MGAVDQLAKAPRVHVCAHCPHSGAWHEKTHDGHVKIGGQCNFPGCKCARAFRNGTKSAGYEPGPRR